VNPRRRRRLRLQRETARDLGIDLRDDCARISVQRIEWWRVDCEESYREFKAECLCSAPIMLSDDSTTDPARTAAGLGANPGGRERVG